jgi:RNA polymerase sigma-70 factor (ECF subfamily)
MTTTSYSPHEASRKEFETLALSMMNSLYSTALQLTRHALDAEDLLQETLLKAWRFFHRFEKGTNFRGWMMRILINTFISSYNNKKREPQRVSFDKTRAVLPDDDNASETDVLPAVSEPYQDWFDDRVTAALNQLPDFYRNVVILSDVNDLKYQEIADLMKCPIGTVMSRISRGRKMLARSLKGYAAAHGYVKRQRQNVVMRSTFA